MLYAQVVLGIAVEGPFDYVVPKAIRESIAVGSRVQVSLRARPMTGYVTALSAQSAVKKVKPVARLIDAQPILDQNMLALTRGVAQHYGCSWGEAIETAIPEFLRRGRRIARPAHQERHNAAPDPADFRFTLIHDRSRGGRWNEYIRHIRRALEAQRGIIVLVPDTEALAVAHGFLKSVFPVAIEPVRRHMRKESEVWLNIREGLVPLAVGTRSAVFAPMPELGLIIIDEEQDDSYKQDQVPHYHAREVALMRGRIEGAEVVAGSHAPSLESFRHARETKSEPVVIYRESPYPDIKILNPYSEYQARAAKKEILSKYLEDAMADCLAAGGRMLLFAHRSGFATYAFCHNCGTALRCSRCASNLVYHFSENILRCRHCAFRMAPPKICPACSAGYIKYAGSGDEKVESELHRIFPQARIRRIGTHDTIKGDEADIFIATRAVIRRRELAFDLIGVLGIDNALNRVDIRAAEKVYALLDGLISLTDTRMIIQSRHAHHHCFESLAGNDPAIFYAKEFEDRRELLFPPFGHLILVKLRGRRQERVKTASRTLFERLSERASGVSAVKIVAVNPAQPAKLRGNFYYQILAVSPDAAEAVRFLKANLRDFKHSGIIITLDVDPV